MKRKTIRHIGAALVLGAALTLGPVSFGQEAVSETTTATTATTTSDGTISEFAPGGDTIVLHSSSGTEPLRYSYSKSTTIVDDSGNPVDVSVVKSGLPVEVSYVKEGDRMIARKIIVKHHVHPAGGTVEKESTTTTTTESH